MTWTPAIGEDEMASSGSPPVLRARSALLLLRIRIELLAQSLPSTTFVSTFGRVDVRLWALVTHVRAEDRDEAAALVRQVQRIYGLTSAYLHSRRAAIVPSYSELSAWTKSVTALESLVGTP
ncbi:hypothetical protein [Lentzea sp. NPDC003310]|uniref:hypothetical protein n=1 Tax=Lentzea sp. NPDC003310 TaxID=3154447 RepID=UPI0033BAF670